MFQSILKKQKKRIVGLMSGTSMDGIDAALLEVIGIGESTRFEILAFDTLGFSPTVNTWLRKAGGGGDGSPTNLCRLNALLGEMFAQAVDHICRKADLPVTELDLVGSHGQTVAHMPDGLAMAGIEVRGTLQIGEPSIIAERTGVTTVADFRPRDVAAGGQGAPLMAYVDYLLLRSRARGRIALNLGGIANLTGLPAACRPEAVVAFDAGPGNALLDRYVGRATGGRERFDWDGRYARRGTCIPALLERLLDHPFLQKPPPKSCDRNTFSLEWVEAAVGETGNGNAFDVLATLSRYTAGCVRFACEKFLFPRHGFEELIVSGGGTRNESVMENLSRLFPRLAVLKSDAYGIPADAKEAVGIALLANEAIHGRSNHLPSATGARGPTLLGKILPGRNAIP
jgi:anhydro-N-acetylmuramic acid kinase